MTELKITTDYPPGLKPWDGRFQKDDRPANVVVLALFNGGREAHEYAFQFFDDAFQVRGRRHKMLVSPKRGRWAPSKFMAPFVHRPIVPFDVMKAATLAYLAMQRTLTAEVTAYLAEQKAREAPLEEAPAETMAAPALRTKKPRKRR